MHSPSRMTIDPPGGGGSYFVCTFFCAVVKVHSTYRSKKFLVFKGSEEAL